MLLSDMCSGQRLAKKKPLFKSQPWKYRSIEVLWTVCLYESELDEPLCFIKGHSGNINLLVFRIARNS
jgi:hypothetical protein